MPPSAPSTTASQADVNELSDDTESVAAERKMTYCRMSASVSRISGTIIRSCWMAKLVITDCIAGLTSDEKLRWKMQTQWKRIHKSQSNTRINNTKELEVKSKPVRNVSSWAYTHPHGCKYTACTDGRTTRKQCLQPHLLHGLLQLHPFNGLFFQDNLGKLVPER